MIGRSTKVDERASIKRSVIGKHCVIGKMAKVVGCVLLDHCVIADGYALFIADQIGSLTFFQSEARRVYPRCIHEGRRKGRSVSLHHTARIRRASRR